MDGRKLCILRKYVSYAEGNRNISGSTTCRNTYYGYFSTSGVGVTGCPSICAGILVERGSVLSHAAILSRELGVPCAVGVAGLLATVRDGDLVELDGAAGVVRILESREEHAK